MKVLIAEDDENARIALTIRIGEIFPGCEIVAVRHGGAAYVEFFTDPHLFDLVITDQEMPRMKGCELIRKIQKLRPETKIILMSSDNMSKEAKEFGVPFADKNYSIDWKGILTNLGFKVS